MTTEVLAPLPIPEQTIIGQGSYTVPANKYAFLTATASCGGSAGQTGQNFGSPSGSAGGTSNHNSSWLVAGDTVSISNSFPNSSGSGSGSGQTVITSGYAFVLLNAVVFCVAYMAACSGTFNNVIYRHFFTGSSSYTLSLFPIPKNNLPDKLKEGN